MALGEPVQVFRCNINNASFIYFTIGNQAASYQFAQPFRRILVNLVVVGFHDHTPFGSSAERMGKDPSHNFAMRSMAMSTYSCLMSHP